MLLRLARKSVLPYVIGAVVLLGAGLAATEVLGRLGVTNPFGTEVIDRSQPALLVSIKDLSEYHAAVGNFEVVLDLEQDVKWIPGFIVGERSLFVAAGTVDSYLDFSGLAKGDLDVSEDGKSVAIRLPEAELGKPNLDHDRTYLVSQERGIVNKYEDFFSTQDQSELYREAEAKLASAAEQSKLTAQAEENAKAMLTGMLTSLGFDVTFVE